jgi:hypothetical protein
MSKEPTIEKLGGNTYIICSWDVDKALETLVWLTKTFGEGLLTLLLSEKGEDTLKKLAGDNQTEEDEENEKEMVAEFAGKVIDRLDAKEYVKYAKIIVSGTRCNGEKIDFNHHFIGKMGELHRLLFAILKHQYSDFLGGSGQDD